MAIQSTPAAHAAVEAEFSQSFALDRFFPLAKVRFGEPDAFSFETTSLNLKLSRRWSLKVRGSAETYLDPDARPLFRVGDLAFSWAKDPAVFEVSLGRQTERWSDVDRFWGLGMFSPRFRVEPFRPEEDGLIGVHGRWNPSEKWSIALTFSPVAFPDQGPPLTLKNGVFLPVGPWSKAPPRQMQVGSQAPQYLSYDLQADVADLLLRPSVTGAIRFGDSSGGFASTTVSYGALHSLLMAAQVSQSLSLDVPTQVTLRPRMIQRVAAEVQAGYRAGGLAISAALMHEAPLGADLLSKEVTEAWFAGVVQDLTPSTLVALQANWQVDSHLYFGAGLLHNFSAPANDTGLLAPDQGTLFDPRFYYRSALRTQSYWALPGFDQHHLALRGMAIADFGWRGVWTSSDLEWTPKQGLRVRLGLDLIKSFAPDPSVAGLDLSFDPFRRYRANDRIRGEIAYAF